MGGRDELLRHEDRPQQRHLAAVAAAEQPAGHRVGQVRGRESHNHAARKHMRAPVTESWFTSPKQKQTLPICRRLKYYANAAKAEPGRGRAEPAATATRSQWKQ